MKQKRIKSKNINTIHLLMRIKISINIDSYSKVVLNSHFEQYNNFCKKTMKQKFKTNLKFSQKQKSS